MKLQIYLITFFLASSAFAQLETMPHGLTGGGIEIKREGRGGYFRPYTDTNLIVYISGNWDDYAMMNNKYDTILKGHLGGRIAVDYFQMFGQWKEYFPNGKVKIEGFYDYSQPVGVWKFYHSSGKLKPWYSISKIVADSSQCYCRTGYFEDFYENGNLKMSGFYSVALDTLVEVAWVPIDDAGNIRAILGRGYRSKPDLTWTYYKPNGEIERKVEY
jgi:antitoxin component YwqK of YwqJK toxin-antitoxin module